MSKLKRAFSGKRALAGVFLARRRTSTVAFCAAVMSWLVPVFPANSPTMDVVPRESSNRSSLGTKHKAAPLCLKLSLKPPSAKGSGDVTSFFLKARSRISLDSRRR